MTDLLYKLLGRSSEMVGRLVPQSRGKHPATDSARFDRTGLTVKVAHPLEILHKSDDLLYAKYDRPSHAWWRAQELSLFWQNRKLLASPTADFGCGDGSFASVLVDSIDYGIDHDSNALDLARGFGVYRELVQSEERSIPISNDVIQTIISNSVLEHVSDLRSILRELWRILKPGGRMIFTVPVVAYAEHLAKYYGHRASERDNRDSYHRNLMSELEWRRELGMRDFAVELVIQYQPDWHTFWYRFHRLAGPNALGRFIPELDRKLWHTFKDRYLSSLRESISNTREGANIFVVARKGL